MISLEYVLTADCELKFKGCTEAVVKWLEEHYPDKIYPLWVFIEATGDTITASQYLDLAT